MLKNKETKTPAQPKSLSMRTWHFVSEGIWDVEVSSLSYMRRTGVKFIRVVHLVIKGFRDDQCPLHASALTFSTLMSIVPVLAVSLALARGLGAGDKIERMARDGIDKWTQQFGTVPQETTGEGRGQASGTELGPEEMEKVRPQLAVLIKNGVSQVFDYVNRINFAALGGVGLALLLWSVVMVLGKVEFSFNKVWGVKTERPLHRKFFDYLGVLIVLPMLIVAASSMPVADVAAKYLNDYWAQIIKEMLGTGLMKNAATVVLTMLACTFLIMFMPNTKVQWGAGLGGGAVAGLLFVVWVWLCAKAQVGVANYSKIYASFAVLPIMLYWMFMSWEILLFGAEVAFATQNCTTYRMESRAHDASARSRLLMALSIVKEAAKAMSQDTAVVEIGEYARRHKVPVRLVIQVVNELVHAGLLAELAGRPGNFVLLKSPEAISVGDVVGLILDSGSTPSDLGLLSPDRTVEEALQKADAGLEKEVGSISLKALAAQ